ncbi:MAG: hypothetical protein V4449_01345 [Patescibacteria group bacterium]
MASKNKNGQTAKMVFSLLAAVVITGGAFFVASGTVLADSNSLVAAVLSAFSGKPVITITRASTSPSGTLALDQRQTLAVFDVKATNVKWQANLDSFTVSIPISGAGSALAINDFAFSYTYCTTSGVAYGYGYQGGACGTMSSLEPSSVTRNGNTYTLVFVKSIPVYLKQSSGMITITGTPTYVTAGMKAAQIRVAVTAGTGIGDQCKAIQSSDKKKNGYLQCSNQSALVNVGSAKGNTLVVTRPPGYGYPTTPVQATTTIPKRPTRVSPEPQTTTNIRNPIQ